MNKTFGELSIDEKLELHRDFYEGRVVQCFNDHFGVWMNKYGSEFDDSLIYRIKPEPETDIELPWHVISPEYQWAARDANGAVWVYAEKPSMRFDMWTGVYAQDCNHLIHKPGNKPWDQSLVKRPEGV